MNKQEAQEKRLKELNATTDWHKYNLKRRWGLTNSSDRYGLNLATIWYTTHQTTLNPPKKLIAKVAEFTQKFPQYKDLVSARTTARMMITLYAFHLKGLATAPIHHLLMSITWYSSRGYRAFMDKPKQKVAMMDKFNQMGLPNMIIPLAKRLLEKEGMKIHTNKVQHWLKDKPNSFTN